MRAFGIFNPPFDGAQAIVFSVSLFDGGRAVDGESESQLHVPLGTPAQRLHEIYDLGRFSIRRDFYLFASVLFTQQFFQRVVAAVLEVFRIEMSTFGFDDMRCKISFTLAWDIVEIFQFVAHLVGIAQRRAQDVLAARLRGNRMLPRCEYDAADSNHAFLFEAIPDDGEGLRAGMSVRHDVIRV